MTDKVTILVDLQNNKCDKFKVERFKVKSLHDVLSLLKERHEFKEDEINYFDNEDQKYITLTQHTFELAEFDTSSRVQLQITSACPTSESTNNTETPATPAAKALPEIENIELESLPKMRDSPFPKKYSLPELPVTLRSFLDKANGLFKSNGQRCLLEKKHLTLLMVAIVSDIFKYTFNPSDQEAQDVAQALIDSYPCLGSKDNPTAVWVTRISSKCSAMRGDLRKSGNLELSFSKRKLNVNDDSGPLNKVKRMRRGEVNFQPNVVPVGETPHTLEKAVEALQTYYHRRDQKVEYINSKMNVTFALRRKFLNEDTPPVTRMKEVYPFLFENDQVSK